MAAAAHNPAFAKKVGISTKVAKEFNQVIKVVNLKKVDLKEVNSDENPGLIKNYQRRSENKMGYMKKGGMAKKYKEGGMADIAQDKKITKKAIGMTRNSYTAAKNQT
jgi:hypothetical protein